MDRNLQSIVPRWVIFFYCVCSLTESRFLHKPTNIQQWTHGNIQPQLTALKQQHTEELRVRPRPVVVKCHPDSMEIVVQADMFDTGILVDGGHLRLGSTSASKGSECGAVPSGEAEFTIHVQLMGCGTTLSSTEENIIYSNVLVYSPQSSPDGLLRLDGATIPVECHYEKKYAVDGISLHPAWIPFVAMASTEDQIDFSLLLMTDDWQFHRGPYTYFLGDTIHFEVTAFVHNHIPLRVYVDHCVATATPDTETTLKYDFIDNHGCLADAYLTNSKSRFLPRVEENKLRFQLDAFRFYQEPNNQVYITCNVKAVPVALGVNSQNRACSLIDNRWQSLDGNDQVCRSCDSSHRFEEPPSTKPPKTPTSIEAWPTGESQESSVQNKHDHHSATYVRFRQEMPLRERGTDVKTQETLQLGPFTVLPSKKFVSGSTD